MTRTRSLFALLASAVVLAGCGTDEAAAPAATPAAKGAVVKGPVANANIGVFEVDASGFATGSALTTATADAEGLFSIDPFTPPAGATIVLVKACGGPGVEYVDESDPETDPSLRRKIALGASDCLQTVLTIGEATVVATPYAMALLQKARQEFADQTLTSYPFPAIFAAVRQQATLAFGFDPFTTIPANPITGEGGSQAYAMLLGGAANATNALAVNAGHLPTFSDVLAFINDLSDGALNGACPALASSPCGAGGVDLNAEIRRFRSNNVFIYGSAGAPGVDEDALSQPALVANQPPTLNALPALSLLENAGLQTVTLSGITPGASEAGQTVTVTATSSNPALIPTPSVSYTSPATTGSLSFTPVAGQTGSATITVTVTDSGGTANGGVNTFSRSFVVTVAVVNETATLLPFVTAAGQLKLYDPTLALVGDGTQAGHNPRIVDTGLSGDSFREEGGLFQADIDGLTGIGSDIHRRGLVYVKGGQVFRVELTKGANNLPQAVSSIADACSVERVVSDSANAFNSALLIETDGTNNICEFDGGGEGGSDDEFRLVNVSATTGLGTQIVTDFANISELNDAAGVRIGSVGVEGSCSGITQFVRRDANFANPSTILNLQDCGLHHGSFSSSHVYFRANEDDTADPAGYRLYRYNVGTDTLDPPLYEYTVDTGSSANTQETFDENNRYFTDGHLLWQISHTASSPTQLDSAAGFITHVSVSPNAVVYEVEGIAGGVFAVPIWTGGSVQPPVTLGANTETVSFELATVEGNRVFLNKQDTFGVFEAYHVLDDGSSPTLISGVVQLVGATAVTTHNFRADGDSIPSFAIVGLDATGGNGHLIVVDPATGTTGLDLGTIPAANDGQLFNFGRYAIVEAQIDRGGPLDLDIWALDMLTAGSLTPLAQTVGGDDFDPTAEHGSPLAGPPPANDNFADAVTVTTGQVLTQSTGSATEEALEQLSCEVSFASTVWFAWTPSASGTFAIDTIGSDFDTVLAVYEGSPPLDTLSPIGCNDDTFGLASFVAFPATSGTTYWIQASGFGGAQGNLQLNVQVDSDGDGLTDGAETIAGTSSADSDSDNDGLSDFDEVNLGAPMIYDPGVDTDPNDPDTDNDGLPDGSDPNPVLPDSVPAFFYLPYHGDGGGDFVVKSADFPTILEVLNTTNAPASEKHAATTHAYLNPDGSVALSGADRLVFVQDGRLYYTGLTEFDNPEVTQPVPTQFSSETGASLCADCFDVFEIDFDSSRDAWFMYIDSEVVKAAKLSASLGEPPIVVPGTGSVEETIAVYHPGTLTLMGFLRADAGALNFYDQDFGFLQQLVPSGVGGLAPAPDTSLNKFLVALTVGGNREYRIVSVDPVTGVASITVTLYTSPVADYEYQDVFEDATDFYLAERKVSAPIGGHILKIAKNATSPIGSTFYDETIGRQFHVNGLTDNKVVFTADSTLNFLDKVTPGAVTITSNLAPGPVLRTGSRVFFTENVGGVYSAKGVTEANLGAFNAGIDSVWSAEAEVIVNVPGTDGFLRFQSERGLVAQSFLDYDTTGVFGATLEVVRITGEPLTATGVFHTFSEAGDERILTGGVGLGGVGLGQMCTHDRSDCDIVALDLTDTPRYHRITRAPVKFEEPTWDETEGQGAPVVDTDGDGLPDSLESTGFLNTDPGNSDTDGDGVSDLDEVSQDGNPYDYNPGGGDTDPNVANDADGDGLSDVEEAALGTNPNNPDTDGDGLQDGADPDPLLGLAQDADRDGVSDLVENSIGSDPNTSNIAIFVSGANGNDGNDGLSWSSPLQHSAAAVAKLDSVTGGSYPALPAQTCFVLYDQTSLPGPSNPAPGNLTLSGPSRQHIAFFGGLGAGVEQPDLGSRTVFEAASGTRVVEVTAATSIWIDSVEVTGGNSTDKGGGVFVHGGGGAGSVLLRAAKVTGNAALDGGGAAVQGSASITIIDSTLAGNSATGAVFGAGRGGGVYAGSGASLTIMDSLIRSNTANNTGGPAPTHGGGGVYAEGGTTAVTVENSVLADNKALNGPGGGANLMGAGSVGVQHSLFAANVSERPGGGLHIHPGGTTDVFNNLVVGNLSKDTLALGTDGGGIEVENFDGDFYFRLEANTIAYNQVNEPGAAGGGISLASSAATPFDLLHNIVWYNDNTTVGTVESGEQAVVSGNHVSGSNNVNEEDFPGNAAAVEPISSPPLSPFFTEGFYLKPGASTSIDGANTASAASVGLTAPYTTDPSGLGDGTSPNAAILDLGFHHGSASAGAFTSATLTPSRTFSCASTDEIIFTPAFANAPSGDPGHLIVVELSGVTPTLSSLTTLDPRASGSRVARDLGDGRYAVTTNGFQSGTATGTFTVYADDDPTPRTFTLAFTNGC